MDCVIDRIIAHGADVKEFQLRRRNGAPLPDWQPGAHIILHFAAADGARYQRHYSLIGKAGAADRYRIAVQREARGLGGSRCLHDEFAAGDELSVLGPYNSFALTDGGARVLLIGGGIGITPLLSMAHALDTPFELHYLVHGPERLIFLDQLRAIPHATIVPHVSRQTGRADLGLLLGPWRAGDHAHACGPVTMLQGLAEAAARQGWPAGSVHVESFGARAEQSDAPLTVRLSLSDMTIEVAAGTSILDALLAADAFVSYDCKRGECGNCYTRVLEGQPVHRDVCLTPAMRADGMCTCVSWAAAPGHLVLEL